MTTVKPPAIAKPPTTAKPHTTAKSHTAAKSRAIAKPTPYAPPFRLPDPPEDRYDEKMTSAKQLTDTGNAHHLAQHLADHLGNPETTIVSAERYLVAAPTRNMAGSRYPDLLIALNADPAAYYRSNGYIIDEQGKPPDFVLEIASPSTGIIDVTTKRADYAAMGILEYWRFDETGEHHGARLAGDRLVDGRYVPIPIDPLDPLADDILQGHSLALNILLRWEQGWLAWHDPATGEHIATFASERARANREQAARIIEHAGRIIERDRANRAEARAAQERAGRIREQAAREQAEAHAAQEQAAREQAEAHAAREQAARQQAEARIQQLEAQLHNQPNP